MRSRSRGRLDDPGPGEERLARLGGVPHEGVGMLGGMDRIQRRHRLADRACDQPLLDRDVDDPILRGRLDDPEPGEERLARLSGVPHEGVGMLGGLDRIPRRHRLAERAFDQPLLDWAVDATILPGPLDDTEAAAVRLAQSRIGSLVGRGVSCAVTL